MPRLFTGIEIPAAIGERLSFLRGGLPGARWIDRENYHLTLRFVGDIDMDIAEEIAAALTRIRRPSFKLRIAGISALGTRKPHAIVARAEPSAELTELRGEHERIMQRIGLPPESRKFMPHVTLARLRGASTRDIADYLSARGGFLADPFPVDRFVLFSARNSTGGGPYLIEETYPLTESEMHAAAAMEGYESWQTN
jgi:RNA 2',3'-cyclic 3'-phosphodiesterase